MEAVAGQPPAVRDLLQSLLKGLELFIDLGK
jgi:hypothetical protein